MHPQSVIHSMVEYVDGSVIAQLGNPDMRTPIAYALAYPERIESGVASLDFFAVGRLAFEPPDLQRFPCLGLAYQALRAGGSAAGRAERRQRSRGRSSFLRGELPFDRIPALLEDGAGARRRPPGRTAGRDTARRWHRPRPGARAAWIRAAQRAIPGEIDMSLLVTLLAFRGRAGHPHRDPRARALLGGAAVRRQGAALLGGLRRAALAPAPGPRPDRMGGRRVSDRRVRQDARRARRARLRRTSGIARSTANRSIAASRSSRRARSPTSCWRSSCTGLCSCTGCPGSSRCWGSARRPPPAAQAGVASGETILRIGDQPVTHLGGRALGAPGAGGRQAAA